MNWKHSITCWKINILTRQMIIIVGAEPELCCGMVRCRMAKRKGGRSVHAQMITCAQVLSRMPCALYVQVWKRVCVKRLTRNPDTRKRMATPTRKRKYEDVSEMTVCNSVMVHSVFLGEVSLVDEDGCSFFFKLGEAFRQEENGADGVIRGIAY